MSRCICVIPTYDEAENLEELLPRVLAQDPRLEVLVVDDHSPDGTGKVADEWAAREPRVRVLHRPGFRAPRPPTDRLMTERRMDAADLALSGDLVP